METKDKMETHEVKKFNFSTIVENGFEINSNKIIKSKEGRYELLEEDSREHNFENKIVLVKLFADDSRQEFVLLTQREKEDNWEVKRSQERPMGDLFKFIDRE